MLNAKEVGLKLTIKISGISAQLMALEKVVLFKGKRNILVSNEVNCLLIIQLVV